MLRHPMVIAMPLQRSPLVLDPAGKNRLLQADQHEGLVGLCWVGLVTGSVRFCVTPVALEATSRKGSNSWLRGKNCSCMPSCYPTLLILPALSTKIDRPLQIEVSDVSAQVCRDVGDVEWLMVAAGKANHRRSRGKGHHCLLQQARYVDVMSEGACWQVE